VASLTWANLIACTWLHESYRHPRYALRIPTAYAESVQWRRRRAGRIDAIHPLFLVLGGTAGLVYQALESSGEIPHYSFTGRPRTTTTAAVARAARLSLSATSAALRTLAEQGLAERDRGGWCRGDANLDDVAESTGAAAIHQERAERYKQDRESWRARLRAYASARNAVVAPGDGWLGLDDEDDWAAMLFSRWPVLSDDFVRGPPGNDGTVSDTPHGRAAG
jgi:hypothetical protein